VKIAGIHIEGFGHFHDRTFGPFDAPLTVIAGENEAGKSTLLAFVRTMLFGFPARHRPDHYPALRGGRHGGRLTFAHEDGHTYTVERFEDSRGTSLRVADETGRQWSDETVLRQLLGHASQNIFNAVFAVGLAELQDLKRLNETDASKQIYAAGMGAAGLPRALKSIDDLRGDLYAKGGSKQVIADLLRRLAEVETRIEAARGDAARFAQLSRRREELREEIAAAKARVDQCEASRAGFARLEEGRGDWLAYTAARAELEDLPDRGEFPEDGVTRLDALETELQRSRDELRDARDGVGDAVARTTAPVPHETLLADAARLDAVREGIGSFRSSVADLPKRQTELRDREAGLSDALRDLGPDWSEHRAMAFDASIPVREAVARAAARSAAAEKGLEEAFAAQRRADDAVLEAAARVATRQGELDDLPTATRGPGECEVAREAIGLARARLTSYVQARGQRENAEQLSAAQVTATEPRHAAADWRAPAAVVAAAGILAGAGGAIAGGDALPFGAAVAVGLLLTAGALFVAGRRRSLHEAPGAPPANTYLDSLRRAEAEARAALVEAAAPFFDGVPPPEALETALRRVEHDEAANRDTAAARKRLDEATAEHVQRAASAEEASINLRDAVAAVGAAQRAWGELLAGMGLPPDMVPGTLQLLVSRLEAIRGQIGGVRELRHRVDAIQQDIDEYRARVAELAAAHGQSGGLSDVREVERAALRLFERFDQARDGRTRREQAQESLEAAQRRLAAVESREADIRARLEALLAAGGTPGTEEFRHRAADHLRRRHALDEFRRAEVHLEQLSGPGARFEAFLAALAETTPDDLAQQQELALEGRHAAGEERDALQTELGRVTTEIDRLTGDTEASGLRAERAVLLEQLKDAARQWARLTIAQALLVQARRKYEAERQPDVLRRAGEFFTTITDGRYNRLTSPLGTQDITVLAGDGTVKKPAVLSRGTEDQLYLALRFGLIAEFGKRAAHLPVVVDDILVNFDPTRARRAAAAFVQLAETNQVLVFTCHPSTVEYFREASPGVAVIRLDGPGTGRVLPG